MLRRILFTNFKLVYRLSRWSRQRLSPLGSVLAGALVGAGVFGIDTRQTLAFQLAALLFTLFAVAVVASIRFRPSLRLRRVLPQFTTAEVPFSYSVCVRNEGRRIERDLKLSDQVRAPLPNFQEFIAAARRDRRNLFDRFVGYPRWIELVRRRRGLSLAISPVPTIPPGEEIEIKISVNPTRRGYVHFQKMSLLRPDPLGLFNAVRVVEQPQSMLVLPKRYAAPRVQLSGRRRYQPGGEGLASSVGDSQEFASLRDYRPGDPMRHIHWRSWARTGKPIVKEFQDEFFDRNALVLDTFAATADREIFEEAVSVAASFACADWGPDSLLDLLFVGPGAEQFTAGRGLADTSNMLEVLACVEPCADQDFDSLGELVIAHAGQLSGIVCVFQQWDRQRRELIGRLQAQAVALLVLVIVAGDEAGRLDPGPLRLQPQRFIPVQLGQAARILATLDLNGGGARAA